MSGPEETLDLQDLVAELAADLEDTSVSGDGGVVAYRRGETVFARASADFLELRLPVDIADAAARTPDTVESAGAPGWIRFTPRGHERHVADRATAWFETAWRHAVAR
jgi:hypothetical protein